MISGVKCLLRQAVFGSISGLIFMRIRCSFWPSIASYHCWILFISIPRRGYNYTWFSAEIFVMFQLISSCLSWHSASPQERNGADNEWPNWPSTSCFDRDSMNFIAGKRLKTERKHWNTPYLMVDDIWWSTLKLQFLVFTIYSIFRLSDRGIYTGPNLTKAVIFTGKKWALRGACHKNHVLIIGPLKHIYINIIYWNCNHLESDCELLEAIYCTLDSPESSTSATMVSHFLQVNSVEHPFGEASGGNSADWQICLRFFIVDFMGFNGV